MQTTARRYSAPDGFLLTNALRENFRFRRVLTWLLVLVALFVMGRVVRSTNPTQSPEAAYVLLAGIVVYKLVALVAAIFAMGVVATEVEQKTIVYLLTRPLPRWKLLLWRTVGAIAAVAAITMGAALAVSWSAYGMRPNPLLGRDLVAVGLGAAAYTSFFVLISLLVNRAMVYCLVYAFGWETAVPNMSGDVGWLSLNTFVAGVGAHPEGAAPGGVGGGSTGLLSALSGTLDGTRVAPATAATVLLIVAAVTLIVGMLWFSNFEYVPREDAE